MLDDLQVLYYDRNIKKCISRSQPSSTNVVEDPILEGANIVMEDAYNSMRSPAHHVNILSNHTGGVHVHQMLGGCVLDNDNDKPSPVMVWEAYDGTEVSRYNMHNRTVSPQWPQLMWTTKKEASCLMDYTNVYQPICIQTLKYYLEKEKNIVLRKERPRVRLIHKPCTETGEMKVSCLATGFYPRHINLTLLRDGHPIPDEELILGEVLPNGDGTYQTRRTLSIRSEELRERHHYTCSVTHLTLDNKLDINWARRVRQTSRSPLRPVLTGRESALHSDTGRRGREGGRNGNRRTTGSQANLTYEIILTLGQAFEVAYQLALQAQRNKQHGAPAGLGSEVIETKSSRPVPKPRGSVRKSAVDPMELETDAQSQSSATWLVDPKDSKRTISTKMPLPVLLYPALLVPFSGCCHDYSYFYNSSRLNQLTRLLPPAP
ncbi:hypothetical protein COCON_G00145320 [Conger conger]|uniref:Ig-like domain-containing protein n=1 Tax=Conger conger TaxID=82655 RepID=A0A9Q1DBJ8_CONCO|nr:hypothetical protein COCON_G00145320 [Conger conger]